jgi:hypothetical protein
MNLLLRRDRRSGVMGGVTFVLDVRADISAQERDSIARYKFGRSVLYSRDQLVDPGKGLLGMASRLAFKAMNISVTVDDLAGGKRIECKDILEMLAVEEQIKDAAQTFKQILEAAAHFGGEEVVAI